MSEPPCILVVDDTPHNVMLLEDLLTARGYAVKTAADGVEALAKIEASPPDLVLLDIMMPRLNGYQVLERLRQDAALRHIPVVVISAIDELESVVRCLELGAEDYLPKPFNSTLLRARVSGSLERKRMRDEIVRHVRNIERDLEFARSIQLSMVPAPGSAVSLPGSVALHATLQPAREIGGDLYDYFRMAPGKLCLVVADVSDKGASAALFMARTRTTVRLLASQIRKGGGELPTAAQLVEDINSELCQDNPHAMFVSLFVSLLDTTDGALDWCCAGHPAPYVVSAGASAQPLAVSDSMPLGLETPASISSGAMHLGSGQTLFIYTDGITEAVNPTGGLFGDARLKAALAACAERSASDMLESVLREVKTFIASAPQSDDIAALACRWQP